MTEPTNDLEALAAKLDEQLAWATKHCPNAPYVPVRAEMVASIITALRSIAAPKQGAEVVVIDLDKGMWEQLCEAAGKSNWIPTQYMANDWVADCRQFLLTGAGIHPPAKPDAPAEPTGDAGVLADALFAGVPTCGMHEDNSTELFDIDGANETMADAAHLIRSQRDELAALRSRPASDVEVERVAKALCENALGGKRCPCKEVGKFNCADEYPGQQARAAIAALRDDQEKDL